VTDPYDPVPDLAALTLSALYGRHDVLGHAEKVAAGLGLGDEASPETAAGALREALGVPGPVTYDPTDEISVMEAGYQTVKTVADRYGKLTEVGRVGDEVIVIPPPGIGALFYTAAQFAVLREALDRAAMPGVTSGDA
jgi:hypothetical protein